MNAPLRHLFLSAALACAAAGIASADEACVSGWNIAKEHALFMSTASAVPAGSTVSATPSIVTDRLYELKLTPQSAVTFAVPPGKKMLTDGAFAGLIALKLASPGSYRVSVDAPFWIDVVDDGKLIASKDFQGARDCGALRKMVEYELPANHSLIVQVSGAVKTSVLLSVTQSPPPKQ
jgi:hypothetical protein